MRLLSFYLAITLSALGAVAAYGDHIVHERRDILPDAWSEIARLGGQEVLPVRIGLAQSNLDKGHDLLMEMYLAQSELHLTTYAFANPLHRSDPGSPAYGNHLAPDQVHDLFAPAGESVESVRAWLESEGIAGDRVSQSVNKQWLQFDASVQEMERLLRAEYYLYSHADSGRSHIACREYVCLVPFLIFLANVIGIVSLCRCSRTSTTLLLVSRSKRSALHRARSAATNETTSIFSPSPLPVRMLIWRMC